MAKLRLHHGITRQAVLEAAIRDVNEGSHTGFCVACAAELPGVVTELTLCSNCHTYTAFPAHELVQIFDECGYTYRNADE